MSGSTIAAVILAAGGSTRFGVPKQLLRWQGRPLIAHVADMAWMAGLNPIIVVVGAEAEQVTPALAGREVQVLRNYRWQQGLSTSLSLGVAALTPEVDAAVFLPVDQPLVDARFLRALVAYWEQHRAGIVVPVRDAGQRGMPVLFTRRFFAELANLSGDIGGRALFASYPDALMTMPVADPDVLTDVDTPAAYEALLARQTPSLDWGAVKGVICDMDGVLWRGETPLPGLHEFFALLESRHIGYVLATNNASKTPEQYVEKLSRMGVPITTGHVLNSATAAADYLATQAAPGTPVYAIGGPGVREALLLHGFTLTDGAPADYVVVGWDRDLTWRKLATATLLIRGGAGFIATNPDRTFPMEDGLVPGNGAQVAALVTATDVTPVMVGKPSPLLYERALARMGTTPEETLVIGDRLDTDILGGLRLGMPTALVLSGITRPEELPTSPIHPDVVFDNLAALVETWTMAG
ncbi:MAG TPA: HAD-IIA family hydrolase [Anaerolineae bacterium]|nr:HAD-IIA family hydrolase [Anaerolineae bacterium]HQK12510.1 HAD-IIA family hydrolase [Anaerolineae bacterium]